MSDKTPYPSLDGAAETIKTLHWYAKAVGSIPRAFGTVNETFAHPKWWHISLRVTPSGLATLPMPLPEGGVFQLALDLFKHEVQLTSGSYRRVFGLLSGKPSTTFAAQLRDAVAADLGLDLTLDESKFANDEPRSYDRGHAETFLTVIQSAHKSFAAHMAELDGDWGPIQLWPHGFDIAVEWFGTRTVKHEEHGEVTESSAQLNLGFSPGEASHPAPYFYSNPWPFAGDVLQKTTLPAGHWRLDPDSWQGSLLEYSAVTAAADGDALVRAYARAVFDAATPTLTA